MTSSISVVVGTYGDESWVQEAQRAVGSAEAQTVKPASIEHVHGRTLQEARNTGATNATGEWLLFVDGDDWLDAGYVAAMTAALDHAGPGSVLLQPATLGAHANGHGFDFDDQAELIPRYPLSERNFMVIGTVVSKAQFERVGGFGDECCMEDWALWIRCVLDGATCLTVPAAVYVVNCRPGSRNTGTKPCIETVQRIRRQYASRLKAVGE